MGGVYNLKKPYDLVYIRIIRNMMGCVCETADSDKMGFLDLCLTLLLFSCL